MIIEGLLTTEAADGTPHVAPMGPWVSDDLSTWTLRPFESSRTFDLLRANGRCVFHVIDDTVPIVQTALGLPHELDLDPLPDGGWVIRQACHWYRLDVVSWKTGEGRSQAQAKVSGTGVARPFWGWNRAKHAVLEATILATRLHLTGPEAIADDFSRLQSIVDKTAGSREHFAWEVLAKYVRNYPPKSKSNACDEF